MMENEVIIIGAGVAGLTAAHRLLQKNPHLRLLVLEAKDRVGGRVLTVSLKTSGSETGWFDLGGHLINTAQPCILRLLDELGLEAFSLLNESEVESDVPYFGSYYSYYELKSFVQRMEKLSRNISLKDPLKSSAKRFDVLTAEQIITENLFMQISQEIARTALRLSYGVEPSQLSALYFLACTNSSDGLISRYLSRRKDMKELQIKGGAQQIAIKLLNKIGKENVLLSSPVIEVEQTTHHVQVLTHSGQKYRAQYVIIALPPSEINKIQFVPKLPLRHKDVLQHYPVGHLTKFIITYEKAFWRENCVNHGRCIEEVDRIYLEGPVAATFDATTPQGQPAIGGYITSHTSIDWSVKTSEDRKHIILENLADYWGSWVLKPIDYVEKNWGEETYVGGCPTHSLGPAVMSWFNCIREPFRRIFWAGTEASSTWCGYIEGAVNSGELAALQVLNEYSPHLLSTSDVKFLQGSQESIEEPVSSGYQPHIYRWTLGLPLALLGFGWMAYTVRKHYWIIGVGHVA